MANLYKAFADCMRSHGFNYSLEQEIEPDLRKRLFAIRLELISALDDSRQVLAGAVREPTAVYGDPKTNEQVRQTVALLLQRFSRQQRPRFRLGILLNQAPVWAHDEVVQVHRSDLALEEHRDRLSDLFVRPGVAVDCRWLPDCTNHCRSRLIERAEQLQPDMEQSFAERICG